MTLLLARAHIELFYTGEDMLIEIWEGDDHQAMVEAFQASGFQVVSGGSGPSFTIRKIE